MASCSTDGHLWGENGKCTRCDLPKPASPNLWQEWKPSVLAGSGIGLANPEAAAWLTFSPCELKINMKTGQVVIPEGLSLDDASAAFWNGLATAFPFGGNRRCRACGEPFVPAAGFE